MEKSKAAYLILKDLYNGNIVSDQEIGINKKEYAEILDLMQNKDLITGVKITNLGEKGLVVNNQNEKITVSGINYLMENTIVDHEYKLQVSVDEIPNGIKLSAIIDANGTTREYKKTFHKPLNEIDIEAESFLLAAEGLKKDKKEFHFSQSNKGAY